MRGTSPRVSFSLGTVRVFDMLLCCVPARVCVFSFSRRFLAMQFEDFRTEYASRLLERYRYQHLCFNDDIQVIVAPPPGSYQQAVRAYVTGLGDVP